MWLPPRAAPLLFLLPLVAVSLSSGRAGAAALAPCVAVPTLAADIHPGDKNEAGISEPVEAGGLLYFVADDGAHGRELWKSTGLPGGTGLVEDIRTGPTGSSPRNLTAMGSKLFFLVSGATRGVELWVSEGTDATTMMLMDFPAMPSASVSELVAVGGLLYFVADDGTHGYELWKSTGLPGGTELVEDIRQGPDGSFPLELTAVGGTLYFKAFEESTGYELWKSQGSASNTDIVKDIILETEGSNPGNLTAVGGKLFFSASVDGTASLWKSDGTAAGTLPVRNFGDATQVALGSFTAVGDTLFLQVKEPQYGEELWKSDGTVAGTRLVKDIQPGPTDSVPSQLTAVGNTLFFLANDGAHGQELWKSDGSAAGTRLVKDLIPGSGNPTFGPLEPGPGVLLLRLNDPTSGEEPWRSDGTAEGTYQLADVWPGPNASRPRDFRFAGRHLFFVGTHPTLGEELFVVPLEEVDCADPVLSCPSQVEVEAVSEKGTLLSYPPVVATDDALFGLSVGFNPVPGTLPLGRSTVTAFARDLATNTSTCTFVIEVVDKTAPVLLCPLSVEQEATGLTDTRPTFFAVASDAVTASSQLSVQYQPAPGTPFPLGTRSVEVSATDSKGNRSTCSFPLTVSDKTPPRLSCPKELFQVARRAEDLAVRFTLEAQDAVSSPTISADRNSGDVFPLGDTLVSAEARDAAGNISRCAFQVHVVDPEGPSITCPEAQSVRATEVEGAAVSFPGAVATDNLGPPTVSYSHPAGSTFPQGVTEVTATASDLGGQTASCTFTVTVEPNPGVSTGTSCQAGPGGWSLGWLLLLVPVWARRRAERPAR
jgi:ELWxxDGT repeat protein